MYNHLEIESKWQRYWSEYDTFACLNPELENSHKPKFYALDMFPYPSGAGLHVGHPKGYTATDIIARYKHAKGYHVLHPMGWDAFGLPAENYAIKTGTHPSVTTNENIQRFREQLKKFGFSFDWNRKIDTTNPDYYKWSQWIFLKLFEAGLAYESDKPINFCPSCKTGLANEEVVDGKCERCGTAVEKKAIRQWILAITKYADRLLNDIDRLDWPEGIKEQQRNWIGRSEGVNFQNKVKDMDITFENYNSVPQTYHAETFTAIAPEHPLVHELVRGTPQEKEVMDFCEKIKAKKAAGKFDFEKDLEGIFTGRYVENFAGTGNDLPIWVASYILADYGTGIVNCSAHDVRDFAFAKKHDIPLHPVMFPADPIEAEKVRNLEYSYAKDDEGIMEEPALFKGRKWWEVRQDIIDDLDKNGFAERKINYKLRDWIFSRQRYWGEPIPLIHIAEQSLWLIEPARASLAFIEDEKWCIYGQLRPMWTKVFSGMITPFGGKREEHEDHITCLRRELMEELELDLDKTEWRYVTKIPGVKNDWSFLQIFHVIIKSTTVLNCHEGSLIKLKQEDLKNRDDVTDYFKNVVRTCEENQSNTSKVITLYFSNSETLNRIISGMKTIETRALNPDESRPYYGDIEEWDCVVFCDTNDDRKYLIKVTKKYLWKNLQDLSDDESIVWKIRGNWDKVTYEDLKKFYEALTPGYAEKIEKNGLIGFEFEIIGKLTRWISDWLLPDWDLPLKLPEVEKYEPSGDGQSPLATIPAWVNVRLGNNLVWKRETNTMPQWAGSCWYYLRFMDPTNNTAIVDPAVVKYWGEVDSYIGWAEHAVLHLLYARFWHKFLFDIGVVPTDEPFFRLRNVGLILWPDGNKMSKSKGNVINPDEVISEYGADTLRLYEMSMADFSDVAPWNTKAIVWSYRLLERIYRLFSSPEPTSDIATDNLKAMKIMHKTIKKVSEDIENMKFNMAISSINIMVNEGIPTDIELAHEWKTVLARLLQPFAPHMAEECWSLLGNEESIYSAQWPEYISAMTIDDEVQISIQINGKLRGTYPFLRGVTVEEVRMTIETKPEIAKWLEGQEILKEVFIPNKILNIVVK